MILLIDSFSYNLYQMIGKINPDIRVIRNDELTLNEIKKLKPSHIILSPEAGKPSDAGMCEDVIVQLGGKIPILGVCLGHQAICEVFGATITYAKALFHGKQSNIRIINKSKLFKGVNEEIKVARYHSLAVLNEGLPECLKVIAKTSDGEIMAIRHKDYPVVGLQFHPESIYTEHGKRIIENFVNGTM